jgi:ribonuclease P protein component
MIAILCNHLFFTIHCNMFTFQKGEKLKSRKTIGKLFTEGKSFISYPIRFVWVKMESPLSEFPIQMALTVPKRSFPKAVNRNRLRRRIRESYRLNKYSIYTKLSSKRNIGFSPNRRRYKKRTAQITTPIIIIRLFIN